MACMWRMNTATVRARQYQFEMGMMRARTLQCNVKIASSACKGAYTSHMRTRGISGKFSATSARWFVRSES